MITITTKDARKVEVIDPTWYKTVVKNHYTKPAADASTNHNFELEIIEGKFAGYSPQDYLINEKAVSFGKDFFIACGYPKGEWDKLVAGEQTSVQLDEKDCIGKTIMTFISNEKFGNRLLNKATNFMAVKK